MDTDRPIVPRTDARHGGVRHAVARLLTSSLILYLAAVAAQRTWVLLNSDVGQLLRRLH